MNRLLWIDQLKGIGIILMIYAHNFPFLEYYIYTFHMPLFFFVAGIFHPKEFNKDKIIRRAKSILIPYFVWSFFLFLFWFLIGRNYGDSVNHKYSILKNFIGIFYAQGDNQYMNWGIPMWFLPCIFLTFIFYGYVSKIKIDKLKALVLILLITIGFMYSYFFNTKLPWSIDIALVSLSFYSIGNYLKNWILKPIKENKFLIFLVILILHFTLVFFNTTKVDMYRAIYGIPILFLLNGLSGTLMVLMLCKSINLPKILGYFGKHTIVLLALHGRALTVIKLIFIIIGLSISNFSEINKIIHTIIQLLIIIPAVYIINKYFPLLNGKV